MTTNCGSVPRSSCDRRRSWGRAARLWKASASTKRPSRRSRSRKNSTTKLGSENNESRGVTTSALSFPLPTAGKPMTNVTKLQAPYDPFDIENLRIDQSFVTAAGVKKLLTMVPVRKPHRQELVRVHPDEVYRVQAAVIELKDDREIYLVIGPVASQLLGETTP